MFRHHGKGRTYKHNLKLASLLSLVAGMVNIIGVLSLSTLTTNVTGHFAFFSEQMFLENYSAASTYILYVTSFLLGAFISGLIMELSSKNRSYSSYIISISIEISILFIIGLIPMEYYKSVSIHPKLISMALLFSMGLQNALVTKISNSVVRTTHLTGLFTDLGIELSQLFSCNELKKSKVYRSIFLKFMIIGSFFMGGLIGALCYKHLLLKTLFLPATVLVFALCYDILLLRYYHMRRKFRHSQNIR